jgi:hypothetical protein
LTSGLHGCKSSHSTHSATLAVHVAVVILMWGLPDSQGGLVWKVNPPDLRHWPFKKLGLHWCVTDAWPLNFLIILILTSVLNAGGLLCCTVYPQGKFVIIHVFR